MFDFQPSKFADRYWCMLESLPHFSSLAYSLFFSEVKYIANGIYKFTQVLTIFGTKLIKLAAGKQIINSNSTKKRFTVA